MSSEVNKRNIEAMAAHLNDLATEVEKLKLGMQTNSNRIGTVINKMVVLEQGIQMAVASKYGTGSTVVDNGD